jgi:hypothetical protein
LHGPSSEGRIGQRDFRRRTNPMPKPAPGVNAP